MKVFFVTILLNLFTLLMMGQSKLSNEWVTGGGGQGLNLLQLE
jgi:hypothetical protein